MKRLVTVILVVFLAGFLYDLGDATAQSIDPDHERAARELARLVWGDGYYDTMVNTVAKSALKEGKRELETQLRRSLSETEMDRVATVFTHAFGEVYPQSLWEEQLAALYMKHFTKIEVEEMLRFYSTPVGSKFLNSRSVLEAEQNEMSSRIFKLKERNFSRRFFEELIGFTATNLKKEGL